jgi:hypothetical protein
MANNKNVTKRIESTKKYIDSLQKEYSKLTIIREDLAYKKPHSNNITQEEANSHLERMLKNRRSKPTIFKDQIGYIIKREYTEKKGVHFHAIFIYDGQKVQQDAFKADQIGEYWENEITQGYGSYHNCNRNRYDRKGKGIGILDHRDSDKRKILDEQVIAYLCKDDQKIDPVKESKRDRAFTRGIVTTSKEKLGRPRQK